MKGAENRCGVCPVKFTSITLLRDAAPENDNRAGGGIRSDGSRAKMEGFKGRKFFARERTFSSQNSEFVSNLLAPELKPSQTFEIILPNLIHKSKKQNLKKL